MKIDRPRWSTAMSVGPGVWIPSCIVNTTVRLYERTEHTQGIFASVDRAYKNAAISDFGGVESKVKSCVILRCATKENTQDVHCPTSTVEHNR